MPRGDKQEHGRRATIRIGVSGWTYSPWRGHFYPKGLTQKNELTFAARQFPALEINGTFYGLQKPESFARWVETTPDEFVFTVKGSRFITHTRRLRQVRPPSPTSSPPACCGLDRSLDRCFGSFRRTSASTRH